MDLGKPSKKITGNRLVKTQELVKKPGPGNHSSFRSWKIFIFSQQQAPGRFVFHFWQHPVRTPHQHLVRMALQYARQTSLHLRNWPVITTCTRETGLKALEHLAQNDSYKFCFFFLYKLVKIKGPVQNKHPVRVIWVFIKFRSCQGVLAPGSAHA